MLHLLRIFLIAWVGATFLSGCCLLKYWPMPWGHMAPEESKPVQQAVMAPSQKMSF